MPILQECIGSLYTVRADPGQSFTVTCSANCTITCNSGTVGAGGYVYLIYSTTAFPVTVSLSGTTQDSDKEANILIGQGCTGDLSAGPVTLSNYQWSVPGDTFASFEMGTTPGTVFTSGKPYGHVNDVDPSEYQKPNPHWYWKKGSDSGDEKTVSCTATVTPPTGEGDPFTVTAEKKVKVWNPHYEIKDIELGTPTIVGDTLSSGDPKDKDGFWLQGVVATPELFTSAGTGNWCWAQLCKLYRNYGPFGEGAKLDDYVLDSAFPYNTDSNASDTSGTPYDAGVWAFIASPLPFHAFPDTPVIGFYPITAYVTNGASFVVTLFSVIARWC